LRRRKHRPKHRPKRQRDRRAAHPRGKAGDWQATPRNGGLRTLVEKLVPGERRYHSLDDFDARDAARREQLGRARRALGHTAIPSCAQNKDSSSILVKHKLSYTADSAPSERQRHGWPPAPSHRREQDGISPSQRDTAPSCLRRCRHSLRST
jgi:hypothetical protein